MSNMFTYDIGTRVTLAGDIKRPFSQSREHFN